MPSHLVCFLIQTRKIDISLVRCHADATVSSLQRLKGGSGEHLSQIEDFVEQLRTKDLNIQCENLPEKKAAFIKNVCT